MLMSKEDMAGLQILSVLQRPWCDSTEATRAADFAVEEAAWDLSFSELFCTLTGRVTRKVLSDGRNHFQKLFVQQVAQ